MRVPILRVFLFEKYAHSLRQNLPGKILSRSGIGILCLLGIVLGLVPGAVAHLEASDSDNSRAAADVDSRWLPWIGSWT